MDDWKSLLSPEIKDHPSMADFKEVGDLAKSWVNAQSLIGAEKLVIPKDEKDEAGWNQVYAKLGRPEASTGYKLPTIEGVPEGFTIEEERVKSFLDNAHKIGLTQRQAEALYQSYVTEQLGLFNQHLESGDQARAAAEKALRVEWGKGYEANLSLAKKSLSWALGKEKAQEIADRYGNDTTLLRLLAKVGNELSEDVLGPGSPKPGDLTPDSAQKEISAVLSDPKHPYHLNNHPEHKAAVDHVSRLFELVHGTEAVA
jgi:hypothetical protein